MTYISFVCEQLCGIVVGIPIYTSQIAGMFANAYELSEKEAAAAAAVAVKRILDGELMPDLRCYQKGILLSDCHHTFWRIGYQ